jgi:type II secretory ATPase GspE/PulE/Tfp pilus assembly ATPase PilB-like protein
VNVPDDGADVRVVGHAPMDAHVINKASLEDYEPLPEQDAQYPLEFIEKNFIIKLFEDEQRVITGVCPPVDRKILDSLVHFHDKKIVFVELERAELSSYLGRKLSKLDARVEEGQGTDRERHLLDRLANDAPIINLVNSLLIDGIQKGASDIHIESFTDEMTVRYRVDGALHVASRIEKEKFRAVSSRIKIMSNLNIMETRLPQDGRISVHMGDETIDMRVSIVPISRGESIVLRIFNRKNSPLTLEELGFEASVLETFRGLFKVPHGLILVTGPTGCGKTTTLNAVLREIKNDADKIITIEDPVEYLIEGIDQIQTNDQIGLSFTSLLRRVLRQDPNIIMVGEIRDSETAELAVRASLTGHLVFSTLHTNDAMSVISRLTDMEVEPFLLAAVLKGAQAQRLVRKVCVSCAKPVKPSVWEKKLLDRYKVARPKLVTGKGCDKCDGTGYLGRIALVELFRADAKLEDLIVKRSPMAVIREYLAGTGFRTLAEDGVDKVARGLTTIEEVVKAVSL